MSETLETKKQLAKRLVQDAKDELAAEVRWIAVTDEWNPALMKAATKGNQVLAYEAGRFYNAWLEFDEYEGGWLWMDDNDSEPSPSHWIPLPAAPAFASLPTSEDTP